MTQILTILTKYKYKPKINNINAENINKIKKLNIINTNTDNINKIKI